MSQNSSSGGLVALGLIAFVLAAVVNCVSQAAAEAERQAQQAQAWFAEVGPFILLAGFIVAAIVAASMIAGSRAGKQSERREQR